MINDSLKETSAVIDTDRCALDGSWQFQNISRRIGVDTGSNDIVDGGIKEVEEDRGILCITTLRSLVEKSGIPDLLSRDFPIPAGKQIISKGIAGESFAPTLVEFDVIAVSEVKKTGLIRLCRLAGEYDLLWRRWWLLSTWLRLLCLDSLQLLLQILELLLQELKLGGVVGVHLSFLSRLLSIANGSS